MVQGKGGHTMATITARTPAGTTAPPASRGAAPRRATIRAFIRRHPVLTYVGLTFALSVGAAALAAGPDGLPATLDLRMAVGLATLAGPSVAGLLLTGLVAGRPGLRDLLDRL